MLLVTGPVALSGCAQFMAMIPMLMKGMAGMGGSGGASVPGAGSTGSGSPFGQNGTAPRSTQRTSTKKPYGTTKDRKPGTDGFDPNDTSGSQVVCNSMADCASKNARANTSPTTTRTDPAPSSKVEPVIPADSPLAREKVDPCKTWYPGCQADRKS